MGGHLLALPDGHTLKEYRIERMLGAGGFGITYLAFDSNLNKLVAIKEFLPVELAVRQDGMSVMPKSTDDSDGFNWGLERFLDEARTLARFRHPNLVEVYRYFQAHGTGYIVMEYAEGETLASYTRRKGGSLPEAEIRRILEPILDGLKAVHATNFLHRDIKPNNIIIREDGSPVLIDFGAARQAVGARTRSVTSIVTPGYAPIEQYSTKGRQGPWTDIYALGAIAYACIRGNPPPDATERVLDDSLEPLSVAAVAGYSPHFLSAIDRALAVRDTDRPCSIEEWQGLMDVSIAPDLPTILATRLAPPMSARLEQQEAREDQRALNREPRRRRFLAVLLIVLVAGGGAAWWAWSRGVVQSPALADLLGSWREAALNLVSSDDDSARLTNAPAGDSRQQAIALENEVQNLLQDIAGDVPALEHNRESVRIERARLDDALAASIDDIEQRALRRDVYRATQREQRLDEELRLVGGWVARDEALDRIRAEQDEARAHVAALDYPAAVAVMSNARAELNDLEQIRRTLGEALDARTQFRMLRFDSDAVLEEQGLALLQDDDAVTAIEEAGARELELGDYDAAKRAFADGETRLRELAWTRIDIDVERLKVSAEAALDARDAPSARRAIERARQLIGVRERL